MTSVSTFAIFEGCGVHPASRSSVSRVCLVPGVGVASTVAGDSTVAASLEGSFTGVSTGTNEAIGTVPSSIVGTCSQNKVAHTYSLMFIVCT